MSKYFQSDSETPQWVIHLLPSIKTAETLEIRIDSVS